MAILENHDYYDRLSSWKREDLKEERCFLVIRVKKK